MVVASIKEVEGDCRPRVNGQNRLEGVIPFEMCVRLGDVEGTTHCGDVDTGFTNRHE